MKLLHAFAATALAGLAMMNSLPVHAQAAAASAAQAPRPWTYKTKQLDRAAVDALLARPAGLVVLDVRRPDELIRYGGFPAYLSIQAKEVEKYLAYIPKDRVILTVSNHAHRAGAVGDLLTSKGYKVAGAAGSEDYREQGGTVTRIAQPAPASDAAR